jgi:hypothetical protein
MSDRFSFFTLLGIAPFAWGGVLLFTYYVSPYNIASLVAVFLILGVALTSTLAPLLYAVVGRLLALRQYHMTMRQAIRQSALLSLVVLLNLMLRALHSWNIGMVIVTLVAAIVVEVLALARK